MHEPAPRTPAPDGLPSGHPPLSQADPDDVRRVADALAHLRPPYASFASDNTSGVAPAVMAALVGANQGPAFPYGRDRWSEAADERFAELFGRPVDVLLCWGGTGANVVGLASVVRPWEAIVCTTDAHIHVDEAGAPTRFSGAQLLTVTAPDGKLRPDDLGRWPGWDEAVHHSRPAVVSISQTTEVGTTYSAAEIAVLAEAAHERDMLVHVDGARIANAVAATGEPLAAMVAEAGVDLMTFGIAKNGAMYGEAVVYLQPELARHAEHVRKQAGQLPSKTRFVSAQMLALLDDDLWLTHAAHANAMAARLADAVATLPGVGLRWPVEANALFAHVPPAAALALAEWSPFWMWDERTSLVRWMTSYATTEEDVDRFAAGVEAAMEAAMG